MAERSSSAARSSRKNTRWFAGSHSTGEGGNDAEVADALRELASEAAVSESGVAVNFELPRRVTVPSDADPVTAIVNTPEVAVQRDPDGETCVLERLVRADGRASNDATGCVDG